MTRLPRTALVLALLAAGCADRVVPINVKVLTKKCGTSAGPNPTDGVDHYQATITGPDIDPIVKSFTASASLKLDKIPPGPSRVLTLVGYHGDPSASAGSAKAYGQSLPFDVPDTTSGSVDVNLVLRATSTFAGVPTIADPTRCAELTEPRAGHSATLMQDGRVLIAGGYQVNGTNISVATGSDESNWTMLSSAEIFDPATMTTRPVADMTAFNVVTQGFQSPVAFQTGSLLPDGRLMELGGEQAGGGGAYARAYAMIYDPASDVWSQIYVHAPEYDFPDGGLNYLARSRHAVASDSAGRVVIFGGVRTDANGRPALAPEAIWYDPTTGDFHAVLGPDGGPFPLERKDLSAVSVLGGSAIFAAGGDTLDGGLADPPLAYFGFQDGQYTFLGSEDEDANVLPRRTRGALAVLGPDADHLVFAGGLEADGGAQPVTSVVDTKAVQGNKSVPLAAGRATVGACAAALADGRVIVAGGEIPGPVPTTTTIADLYTFTGSATTSSPTAELQTSRVNHTCTVLKDGSVLVTGGVSYDQGKYTVLSSIELYTPAPAQ